jgi:hypothetical protein
MNIKFERRSLKMKKLFIYFLCVSFLLMTGQTHWIVAEAKENMLPIGEMVSKGAVKFEARENVWRNVEPAHFPIFKGTRVKTESGQAILIFPDKGRIEVGPKSLFSFDKEGRLVLTEGSIQFHLPVTSEVNFKVGNLSISKGRTFQASKGSPASSVTDSLVSGSISIHTNGSVTVKTHEGRLNVLNKENVLLAAVPRNESITIPSVTVSGPSRVMVAQVGETATATAGTTGAFLGISTWGWIGIIAGAALIATVAVVAARDDDDDRVPVCP